jgi:hypothetical protein
MDSDSWVWILIVGILLSIAAIYVFGKVDYRSGYKQGQIDAINGKIYYELKKTKDNEIEWTKIKEPDK